ncbi:OmpA family protein [Curvibacter sp. APW13]|uniref:OmpA family protein n=1 Tax=Curvibacter sp. APW13 TaxID=3077236 RepID=UPI0028DFD9FF|nr:OmpA family protein [Curvibacter sp. APW13]MDT8989456.1 OmpA family protein [Curvibacter sp. APW13]
MRAWCAAWAAVVLVGCASPSYVVLLEDPQGGVGKVTVRGKNGTQMIDRAMDATSLDGAKPPEPVDVRRFEADFAAVLAAQPVLPQRYLLYFQSGGAELTPESQALLATILDDVRRRPVADVSVIGHTDTVGNAEANEALGLKRAQGIAALLTEQGLQAFALSVESHGERNPLVPTPDETDEPRNRRVEISVR